ncbi:SKP1-like protein 21 [Sesamum angolense]|uniref:SKP1-like protein 21 n=1 Tax=Sesamum angolense TaxID=2727404 RepID=A0AAE1WPM4_9LAMI|nr:SKP1-like protein 21 [Sesamum angolense]
MIEADSEIIKPEILKAYMWLQTSDGSIQQVEQEVAMFCPLICREIQSGMGSSKNYPISLPSRVNPPMLSLILDYCRFHQVPGRSNKERKSFDEKFVRMDTKRLCELTSAADSLQLKPLVDLTSRALAREEKLEPIKNTMDDPRIRLLNRLYARKRKELKERERLKNIEVEEGRADERSVDDLLSFINGSNEDSKANRASKSKKKNRKRKDHHKAAPSNCTSTSNSTTASSDAVYVNKESNELDSMCSNPTCHGNLLRKPCNGTKLHDIEDNTIPPAEDEFDDCDLDDDIDPALKEKIDREVEDFARRLNSDWPERMQQILSLGQERRTLQLTTNGNGSLRIFTRLASLFSREYHNWDLSRTSSRSAPEMILLANPYQLQNGDWPEKFWSFCWTVGLVVVPILRLRMHISVDSHSS